MTHPGYRARMTELAAEFLADETSIYLTSAGVIIIVKDAANRRELCENLSRILAEEKPCT